MVIYKSQRPDHRLAYVNGSVAGYCSNNRVTGYTGNRIGYRSPQRSTTAGIATYVDVEGAAVTQMRATFAFEYNFVKSTGMWGIGVIERSSISEGSAINRAVRVIYPDTVVGVAC